MLRFVVIAGPTAAGKSDVALEVAERFSGEIVNADSRQVYRYMDVGTDKPSAETRRRVPHHLFDLLSPDETFDAAAYRDYARATVREIDTRGRLPLVVGGTGLYVRALRRGLFLGPRADARLRSVLVALERERRGRLHAWCLRLDSGTAARLHPNDVVRLVRALEVMLRTGRRLSDVHGEHGFRDSLGASLYLVLAPPREELRRRIEMRSRRMFDLGLVAEVRSLAARGYGPELRVLQSIGYAQAWRVTSGEWTSDEALADLIRATRRFAKRQLTWFRGEPEAVWFDPLRDRRRIFESIADFLAGAPSSAA